MTVMPGLVPGMTELGKTVSCDPWMARSGPAKTAISVVSVVSKVECTSYAG
jgi:hypothetical protein